MKMAHVILALTMVGVLGFSSCKTNSERVVPPGLREQVRAGSGELAYIRPGEQLYFFDITIDSESKSIISFMPSGTASGEWPKITFEMEKENLIVKGGVVSEARPVDADGQNKEFYKKLETLLNNDNIDMPIPSLRTGQYIYNHEGLVREIIDNPANIIYKEKVWILSNDRDSGVAVFMHTYTGEILKAYIPEKGYLVIPAKEAKTILRIDIGTETIFPVYEEPTGVQRAMDDFSSIKRLSYKDFLTAKTAIKIYKAGGEGGSVTVVKKETPKTFYLPPHQMVIHAERLRPDTTIEGQGVEEYTNQVLW